MKRRTVEIEGLTPEEILAIPQAELQELVLCGEPIVFRAGTAEVLGEFRIAGPRLVLELAQIDGGGEGVLPTIWQLAKRYARHHRLTEVEWIVHAVNCARPNLKLRRVLERKGFVIERIQGVGDVYHFLEPLENEFARE